MPVSQLVPARGGLILSNTEVRERADRSHPGRFRFLVSAPAATLSVSLHFFEQFTRSPFGANPDLSRLALRFVVLCLLRRAYWRTLNCADCLGSRKAKS